MGKERTQGSTKKTKKKHQEGPVSDDTRMIPDPGASAESLAGRPRVRRQ